MIDSSDHITGKTGLSAGLTIYATKDGGTPATISPTVTELDATNCKGLYNLALTTTHTNTLGELQLHVTATGADPSDVAHQVVVDLPGASVASVSGAVASVTGGVTVTTNNDKTGYTASTVSDKTGYALTAAYDPAKTASQAGDIMKVSTGTGANQLDVTSGVIKANLAQILGTALTETAGQIAAAFKQFFNIASPTSTMNVITTVTTATNLTTNNDKTGYTASTVSDKVGYALTSAYDPAKTAAQAGDTMKVSSGTAAGQISLSAGLVTVGTNNDKSGYTASTVSDKTGYALTSAYDPAKTAAQAGNAMTLTAAYDAAKSAAQAGDTMKVSSGTGAGQISLSSGQVTVGTNNDKTGYTASTVSDKTGYALTSGEHTNVVSDVNTALDAAGTELSAIPTTTGTLRQKLNFLFEYFRNKRTVTASTETLFKEDASTSLGTSTISDDGTTFTHNELN